MIASTRVDLRGLACNTCTVDELGAWVAEQLRRWRPGRRTAMVLCVNAHIWNLAWQDSELRGRLNGADVLALDGMSVVWAARRSGAPNAERCNMTEAFSAFLARRDLSPTRTLVIGLDEAAVARAAAELNGRGTFLRVVRALDGYADLLVYRDAVEETRPALVLIGCGTPRSEEVVHAVADAGVAAVAWHVGGGTLEFLAGTSRESPPWMRKSGLQWVHRLALHPRRMWRRYMLGNPLFILRMVRGGRRGDR